MKKLASSKISQILIFSKNIQKSIGFYTTVLGLKVDQQSDLQAQLKDNSNFKILLCKSQSEAFCSTGFCPLINIQVDSVEFKIHIRKVTNLAKGPDQVMFSVTEKQIEEQESEDEEEIDPNDEIQNLLRKIKFQVIFINDQYRRIKYNRQ